MDILEVQSTIISRLNDNNKEVSDNDIISLIKKNKDKFRAVDLIRLLCLIKYYYPKINMDKIYNNLGNVKLSTSEKQVINFMSHEQCLININKEKLIQLNDSIISYRKKTDYNTKQENDFINDKRYNYTKEAKLTTLCDMASKNKLPENLFTFVEKPKNLAQKKKYRIDLIKENDLNEQQDNEKQNLILFNIGGVSNFDVSSLERGVYLEQFNGNLIIGSNKIYNYKEYFEEIKNYLNGKNEIEIQEEKNEAEDVDDEQDKIREVKIDIINLDMPKEKGSIEKLKNIIHDKDDTISD